MLILLLVQMIFVLKHLFYYNKALPDNGTYDIHISDCMVVVHQYHPGSGQCSNRDRQ